METMRAAKANSKLEVLKKREAEIREAIAQERVRQQKRLGKEQNRLRKIIGELVLTETAENGELRNLVAELLQKAPLEERDRNFLRAKGFRV